MRRCHAPIIAFEDSGCIFPGSGVATAVLSSLGEALHAGFGWVGGEGSVDGKTTAAAVERSAASDSSFIGAVHRPATSAASGDSDRS